MNNAQRKYTKSNEDLREALFNNEHHKQGKKTVGTAEMQISD